LIASLLIYWSLAWFTTISHGRIDISNDDDYFSPGKPWPWTNNKEYIKGFVTEEYSKILGSSDWYYGESCWILDNDDGYIYFYAINENSDVSCGTIGNSIDPFKTSPDATFQFYD